MYDISVNISKRVRRVVDGEDRLEHLMSVEIPSALYNSAAQHEQVFTLAERFPAPDFDIDVSLKRSTFNTFRVGEYLSGAAIRRMQSDERHNDMRRERDKTRDALARILRAHLSGNNGAVMGEARLCPEFVARGIDALGNDALELLGALHPAARSVT